MKISAISTVFVLVEKIDEAKQFYSEKLGFGKPVKETPSWAEWQVGKGPTLFAIYKASDAQLEGAVPARSTMKLQFEVPDIRKAYNELFERGIRVQSEPKEGIGVLYCEFLDIDGNVLRVVQKLK